MAMWLNSYPHTVSKKKCKFDACNFEKNNQDLVTQHEKNCIHSLVREHEDDCEHDLSQQLENELALAEAARGSKEPEK